MDDLLWAFNTANFKISLIVEPEYGDPHDFFDSDEDIEFAYQGGPAWFSAEVRVDRWNPASEEWEKIASDHLGGCCYKTFEEFYTAHRDPDPMNRNSSIMRAEKGQNTVICHYFPDMVSQAINSAREALKSESNDQ